MAKGKRVQKSASHAKKKTGSSKKTVTIIAVIVVVILVLAAVGAGVYISRVNTVYPNVLVSGVSVGGMTFNEAYTAIDEALDLENTGSVTVKVYLTDSVTLELTSVDVGYGVDASYLANLALNYGKDGGTMEKISTYLSCLKTPVDVTEGMEFSEDGEFNEEYVRLLITEAAASASYEAASRQCDITDTEITIVKGGTSYTVDEEAIYEYVYNIFHEYSSGEFETYEFSQENASVDDGGTLDFEALYAEVCYEAVNAYYDSETGEVVAGTAGLTFDIEAAQATYESLEPGGEMVILLTVVEPEITAESISELLFRDILSEKSTSLSTSSSNRITNVTLAAAACNELVLQPGEEFSFNGVVGERTAAKGYKEAGAYVGGETVDQIGGGICQVSSTLYYCALMADLEITHRQAHMYPVSYLPLGLDATVDWGNIDFKFKNDSDYPVKIVAYVSNKMLYVEFWGTKLDENYVELTYEVIETTDYEIVEEVDETLAAGETEVKTSGHKGYKVDNYQYIYDKDGNLLEENYLGRSTYRVQNRVILISPADSTETTEGSDSGSTETTETTESTGTAETPTDTTDTTGTDDTTDATEPEETETEETGTSETGGTDSDGTGSSDSEAEENTEDTSDTVEAEGESETLEP